MSFLLKLVGDFFGKYWIAILKVAIPVLLVLVAFGVVYHRGSVHGETVQATADQRLIDAANTSRDKAIKERAEYVSSYNSWKATSDREHKDLLSKQALINADLENQLKLAESRAAKTHVIIKEVTKYVTAEDDARCVLPTSVVRLYNGSLQDSAGVTPPSLSDRAGSLDQTPSGIALSTFTGVAVANNATALYYYQVATGWQQWYIQHKAAFDLVQQQLQSAQPNERRP